MKSLIKIFFLIGLSLYGRDAFSQDPSYFQFQFQDYKVNDRPACVDVPSAIYYREDENGNVEERGGVGLGVWECNNHHAQKFLFHEQKGEIRSWHEPGLCLDVPGANYVEGAPIHLWECNNHEAQKFNYDRSLKRLSLRVRPDLCLQAANQLNEDGVRPLVLAACQAFSDPQELFVSQLVQIKSHIRGVNGQEMCWDVRGAAFENHSVVQNFSCRRSPDPLQVAQKFVYNFWDGKLRTLANPGLCVDIFNGEFRPESAIQIFRCQNHIAQQFNYDRATSYLRAWGDPNYCVDVQWANNAEATPLHLWRCNRGRAQIFDFIDPLQ